MLRVPLGMELVPARLFVGQELRTGLMDIDALERYFSAQGTVAPVAAPRIQRIN